MFKTGELVSTRRGSDVGVVIETKRHFGVQYCKVLWRGESVAHWVSHEQLRERI
jgi:hypothetical protein